MMATLIDSPEYTANEIYEIQQTDPVEGAGTGASFSGIGVSNEPHQQLSNRTAFLYGRQNTNIANIGALQNFVAGFTGSLRTSGYLKIPLTDVSRGPAIAIIQWGYYALSQQAIPNDTQYTVPGRSRFPTRSCCRRWRPTFIIVPAAAIPQRRSSAMACPARPLCSTFQES
jgi:hypothetical protein